MRILFLGTPAFAVPSLRALVGAGHEVVAVVTQPDRPTGRSRSMVVPPPVKLAAAEFGVPVLQPDKPVGIHFIDQLNAFEAELGVVVAYGHLLRPEVLAIPRLGMINVHASLLPRWRGAAPIQWAIQRGDPTTGVTIMQMEAGLDSGPAWHARAIPIGPGDTGGSLAERLAVLGAEALLETLPLLTSGTRPVKQDESAVTLAPKIDRGTARVDWGRSAEELAHHVAAFDPVPGAWARLGEADIKLFGAGTAPGTGARPAGTVVRADDTLSIITADGMLTIREVQPAGKKRQAVTEWVRGRGVAGGAQFT